MSREKFYDNLKNGWRELRLKYAVELSNSRTESSSNDFAYVGLENIESGTGRLIPKAENQTNGDGETESNSVVNVFEKGDVLFSKLRPYLAKGFIAKEPGTSTTELLVFKPKESTDKKFLLYTLLSPNFVKFVDSATFGSRMPRADWNFVRDIFVPIPPLEEQRAIAAMLDRETARLDELITEKERLLELLAEKRRALITNAVTRGLDPNAPLVDSGIEWLGEIPQHWQPVRIKFLVSKIGSGKTPSGGAESYLSQGITFIRSQNVRFEGLSLEDVVFIDEKTDKEMKNSRVNSGDVLLNITGASIGRCCIVPNSVNRANVNQHVCIVRPISQLVDKYYLNAYLCSVVGQFQIFAGEVGVSREGITFEDIANFLVSLPPLEEQQQITEYIEAETGKIDRMQAATRETVELLKERRSSLIAAAVTGKISVREMR